MRSSIVEELVMMVEDWARGKAAPQDVMLGD